MEGAVAQGRSAGCGSPHRCVAVQWVMLFLKWGLGGLKCGGGGGGGGVFVAVGGAAVGLPVWVWGKKARWVRSICCFCTSMHVQVVTEHTHDGE